MLSTEQLKIFNVNQKFSADCHEPKSIFWSEYKNVAKILLVEELWAWLYSKSTRKISFHDDFHMQTQDLAFMQHDAEMP